MKSKETESTLVVDPCSTNHHNDDEDDHDKEDLDEDQDSMLTEYFNGLYDIIYCYLKSI